MSERLHEYFAAEATEYLDQLESMLSLPGTPDLDQLLRLARGVRGSAQMAGADTLVGVAERLEEGVRSVQANHVVWSDDVRQLSAQTVADLKILVRASGHWGALEEERVRSAIERWDEVETSVERPRHRSALAPEVGIESLFYDDEGPHVLTSESDDDMTEMSAPMASSPVPIESLLLDREGALREALGMRGAIERSLREIPGAEVELAATMRDLFELLDLAAAGGTARE